MAKNITVTQRQYAIEEARTSLNNKKAEIFAKLAKTKKPDCMVDVIASGQFKITKKTLNKAQLQECVGLAGGRRWCAAEDKYVESKSFDDRQFLNSFSNILEVVESNKNYNTDMIAKARLELADKMEPLEKEFRNFKRNAMLMGSAEIADALAKFESVVEAA